MQTKVLEKRKNEEIPLLKNTEEYISSDEKSHYHYDKLKNRFLFGDEHLNYIIKVEHFKKDILNELILTHSDGEKRLFKLKGFKKSDWFKDFVSFKDGILLLINSKGNKKFFRLEDFKSSYWFESYIDLKNGVCVLSIDSIDKSFFKFKDFEQSEQIGFKF